MSKYRDCFDEFYDNDAWDCWPWPPRPRPMPCCCCVGATGPAGPRGEPGPMGPQGEPMHFLSSYIEALGSTQIVSDDANIVFVIADNVGNNIAFTAPGTVFTVTQTGLYLVEWNVNLAVGNTVTAEIGLLQNGELISGSADSSLIGNFSSGALINVAAVPYTISLHNQSGDTIAIEDDVRENGAASIRILRFAEGPTT